MLSSEEAKELILIGRRSVLSVFEGVNLEVPKELKDKFSQKRGVFTTLLTFPDKALRGCVGVPYSVYPLWRAVISSSISASFRDPRFPPLKKEELDSVIWELSLLTEPEEVDKESLPGAIRVGLDGLIVEESSRRGLLLPQVAVRYGWSPEEFLSFTCLKAGLERDCWRRKDVKIYRFQSEIFEEVEPWGEVRQVEEMRCE